VRVRCERGSRSQVRTVSWCALQGYKYTLHLLDRHFDSTPYIEATGGRKRRRGQERMGREAPLVPPPFLGSDLFSASFTCDCTFIRVRTTQNRLFDFSAVTTPTRIGPEPISTDPDLSTENVLHLSQPNEYHNCRQHVKPLRTSVPSPNCRCRC